uniref:C-type lectin domain-containing protein n=1 Tax=Poecilia mexicana TaxID=48701 RepID=A0A3B3WJC3_9TELE
MVSSYFLLGTVLVSGTISCPFLVTHAELHFMSVGECCFMDCQLYQFLYINENKTWTEAQQYCREKHTDLVTVTNMKDMKRLINISAGEMKEAWIGLYYQTDGNRTWYWSLPGVEFNESETNWYPGEPTDRGIQEMQKTRIHTAYLRQF